MNDLDDERPVERAGQRPGIREAKPGERLGGVSGVPHHEHIVPDHRYPVEPHIEVDALALIVVLHEGEQARSGIEVVLQPARGHHRRERAHRQLGRGPGQIGAHDDVATAAPRRRKLEIGAVTRSEEHTSELQSRSDLVCRLLLEKKNHPYAHDLMTAIVSCFNKYFYLHFMTLSAGDSRRFYVTPLPSAFALVDGLRTRP